MKAGMWATIHRTRRLGRARLMTGKERRWINPNKGLVKIVERHLDMIVSRFLYPHLSRVWNPYSWLLERRFVLTETSVSPAGWPRTLAPLRVLLLSDIHTGIFLKPQTLADLMLSVMALKPDLVTIAGDIVTGHSSEVRPFLDALAPLSRAPLGAWYAYGNHDYFGGDPEERIRGTRTWPGPVCARRHRRSHLRQAGLAAPGLPGRRPPSAPGAQSRSLLRGRRPRSAPNPFRPHSWRADPLSQRTTNYPPQPVLPG